MHSSKNTSKPSEQLVSSEDSRPGVKTTRTVETSGNRTTVTTTRTADSTTAEGQALIDAYKERRAARFRRIRGDG